MNTNYTDGGLLTDICLMRINMAVYTISRDVIIKSIDYGISMLQNPVQDSKLNLKILSHDADTCLKASVYLPLLLVHRLGTSNKCLF